MPTATAAELLSGREYYLKMTGPGALDHSIRKGTFRPFSLCVGCGSQIHDQYILRVAPNLEWHAACLKCTECQMFLDENCTCFVRDGKTFCKKDYMRLFGAKCDKCERNFGTDDLVMRAKNKIYHIECFRCVACSKRLVPGDEFALRNDGLFCKDDHQVELPPQPQEGSKKSDGPFLETNNNSLMHNTSNSSEDNSEDDFQTLSERTFPVLCDFSDDDMSIVDTTDADSMNSGTGGGIKSSGKKSLTKSKKGPGANDRKGARARTVLSEKQLNILKTCYSANPRPDALMKEQLVEMTALSPRVIRVWFQNKRCKDKKVQIRLQEKQIQRECDGRKLGYSSMHGIPMVATSPVRHDSPVGMHGPPAMNPVDIQGYEPPWKALTDFALHTDLDRLNPNPQFQHLVNQMHGYQGPAEDGPPMHGPHLRPDGGSFHHVPPMGPAAQDGDPSGPGYQGPDATSIYNMDSGNREPSRPGPPTPPPASEPTPPGHLRL